MATPFPRWLRWSLDAHHPSHPSHLYQYRERHRGKTTKTRPRQSSETKSSEHDTCVLPCHNMGSPKTAHPAFLTERFLTDSHRGVISSFHHIAPGKHRIVAGRRRGNQDPKLGSDAARPRHPEFSAMGLARLMRGSIRTPKTTRRSAMLAAISGSRASRGLHLVGIWLRFYCLRCGPIQTRKGRVS